MKFKKTTLKNGLRILTVPMQGTETATVIVMVGVGSRFETEREAGLSHFIEHMFFKGTERRPTTKDISEELDAFGGEYNAFTSKDRTVYYVKVDSKHIHKAFDVISDMFLSSKIEKDEIEREKGTIIQELNMYEDDPRSSVGDEFEKLLYGKNPLGREVIGCKKTISNFKRKDFINYISKYYNASETIVCVAGKINEKEIVKDAKKYFEKMKKGEKNKIKKFSIRQMKSRVRIKYKKTDQTHFMLGGRAYHRNHKDRYALSLLSVILGGNMSSRLFLEVRERRGLAYFVSTGIDSYEDCGHIATQAGVNHSNLVKAAEVILKEYRKIATKKVSEKELQKAKDFMRGRALMGFESSDEVASFYISQEINKEKIISMKEVLVKIEKVTTGDILRVARDVFKQEKINLAVIGPHRNERKLLKVIYSY